MKMAIPLFQVASPEDNNDLQDRRAAFLVNAANEGCGFSIKQIYVSILERIGPYEAMLLDSIYSVKSAVIKNGIWTKGLPDKVRLDTGVENGRQ
ncbi:MAG: hypothetical protein DRP83_08665 [Planctomycetota bacterium]|nr:MAG: hypothetical protein DRP83_08665 [Planctomycetota bacterium]